ncbi:ABC transporter ATP-binding protein [Pelagovum pacificum]|uniref:ATP-binding cassette domain-containing protein n=1 Tax=Pelagovum pacificum TaxID=2588711 RepID=A0A5C5GD03_9RHOB|nr:oligopeptide/dipeptide ABC transporter ATP-binding protein [Pelagovum pacificum]QQA44255.1 ATP-binding cassette domain-containing protein [Pelagovum pacificum]TNY32623.1 ATP-binding cassette domain-containing protein [Pelagovum pacificum]
MINPPLLDVRDLTVRFPVHGGVLGRQTGAVHAVEKVSFSIGEGEIFGLVGESGSGKTTVARSILRLNEPTDGRVEFRGQNLLDLPDQEFLRYRRRIQMIFQDPFASLNPRKTVSGIIGEALSIHKLAKGEAKRQRIAELLDLVGLPSDAASRYPHEFSGGQRQRIGIARALAVDPTLLVADEPISALDVSIQAQILNLLQDLQEKLGLTILIVAHDLSVVEHFCDRVGVMYLGRMMEVGRADDVFEAPAHPYTRQLSAAAPRIDFTRDREQVVVEGEIPSALSPPSGCVFRTRCQHAVASCASQVPEMSAVDADAGHAAACLRLSEL